MKYIVIILLFSCTSIQLTDRADFNRFELMDSKTMPIDTDTEFESIELHEVRQYWFECKQMLKNKTIHYKANQFDCEDYTRQLIAYIMRSHSYIKTPAICEVIIKNHSLMGFYNSNREFILIDANNGKLVKTEYLKRRF